jgi:hypothetical protein
MKWWLLTIPCIFFLACEKEDFNNNPNALLTISTDSISFDTVFTGIGSVTAQFKIRNDNNDKLLISDISLAGGDASPFKLNINGTASSSLSNITLDANDSMYVFVALRVNPDSATLPFLVEDSILIAYNGNIRKVQLKGYGQNARFLNDFRISSDTTWSSELPFVITGGLTVDSAAMLQLNAGCRLYFHAGAFLKINGSLKVNGRADSMVLFSGDRLDEYYRDLPGSWQGILFSEKSNNNRLEFAKIMNAIRAIEIYSGSAMPGFKLQLAQSIIQNSLDAGIFAQNSSISADNCLLANCGQNLTVSGGGNYLFKHCTIAGYSSYFLLHKKPVAFLSDATYLNGSTVTYPLSAVMTNCILWGEPGSATEELLTEKTGSDFTLTLNNCLLKASAVPSNTIWNSGILNEDPLFDSIDVSNNYFDFHCRNSGNAPVINTGTLTNLLIDLDGLPRNVQIPDIGCYEKQ